MLDLIVCAGLVVCLEVCDLTLFTFVVLGFWIGCLLVCGFYGFGIICCMELFVFVLLDSVVGLKFVGFGLLVPILLVVCLICGGFALSW